MKIIMTAIIILAAITGGYCSIGWLAGTQAWGLHLIGVCGELFVDLLGALLGAITD